MTAVKELLADMITVRLTSKVRLSASNTAEASAKLMAENAAFCVMNNGVVSEVVSLPKDAEMTCSDLAAAASSASPDTSSAPAAKKGGKKGGGKEDAAAEKKGSGSGGGVVQLQQMVCSAVLLCARHAIRSHVLTRAWSFPSGRFPAPRSRPPLCSPSILLPLPQPSSPPPSLSSASSPLPLRSTLRSPLFA
eukprot:2933426-Rhodomonas_salina.5